LSEEMSKLNDLFEKWTPAAVPYVKIEQYTKENNIKMGGKYQEEEEVKESWKIKKGISENSVQLNYNTMNGILSRMEVREEKIRKLENHL